MADFCRDCSIEMFDKDFRELAGLSTPEDTAHERYARVICEGCGFVLVNHEGVVVKHLDNVNRWESWAQWPPEVGSLGNDKNESTDTHESAEHAWSVVQGLRREGFGGEGRFFPIASGVRPATEKS